MQGGGDLRRASAGGTDEDQLDDPEDRPELQAAGAGPVRVHHQLCFHAGLRRGASPVERGLGVAAVLALRLRVQRRACPQRERPAEKRVDRSAGGGTG